MDQAEKEELKSLIRNWRVILKRDGFAVEGRELGRLIINLENQSIGDVLKELREFNTVRQESRDPDSPDSSAVLEQLINDVQSKFQPEPDQESEKENVKPSGMSPS